MMKEIIRCTATVPQPANEALLLTGFFVFARFNFSSANGVRSLVPGITSPGTAAPPPPPLALPRGQGGRGQPMSVHGSDGKASAPVGPWAARAAAGQSHPAAPRRPRPTAGPLPGN